jgi:hypothetical protein
MWKGQYTLYCAFHIWEGRVFNYCKIRAREQLENTRKNHRWSFQFWRVKRKAMGKRKGRGHMKMQRRK